MSLFPDEPSKSTSKRVEVFEAPEPPPLFEARPSPLAAEPAEEPVVRPAAEPIRRPTSIPMAEREVERPRAAPPQGLGETFSESFSNREADFAASGILDPAKEVARGPAPYFAGQPAPPPRRLLPRFSLVLALVLGLSAFAGWWLRDLWWDLVFDSVGAEPLPAAFAQPERSPTRRPLSSAPAETSALPNAADAANAANAANPASPAAVESAAPTASATPLPSLNLLERIDVVPQAGETVVTLVADGIVRSSNYARFRIDSGSPRELVKMRGVRRPFHSASIAVGSPELVKIRTGFHAPEELHIVFDLASPDIEVLAIEESAASLRLRFGRRAR
jgi:hypothetical protein